MSLNRVTNPKIIKQALSKIELGFREGATTTKENVGFPSGSIEERVHWQPNAGIWLCRHDDWDGQELPRHWCAYGVQAPGSVSGLSITLEINFPREGIDRRVSGILAVDPAGKLVMCHTGRLGGGKKGVSKSAFLSWLDCERVPVADGDGRITEAFPIAEIGSERMVTQVAEYVHSCAEFKAGAPSPISDVKSHFGGNEDEFEGSKQVEPVGSYTASCDHGIVRNRLAALLKESGYAVGRDQARDIFVGQRQQPDMEFEIKTACNPQHVYTAVGQLLVHNVTTPAQSRVAVLPSPVPTSTREALESLEIKLVEYRWIKNRIQFDGLDDLCHVVTTSARVNPSH